MLQEEEEAAPKHVQTSFTVKLLKFDEKQKIAIIKEIKNLIEGMNLVQVIHILLMKIVFLVNFHQEKENWYRKTER